MIRPIGIAHMILIASSTLSLAQSSDNSSLSYSGRPPQVLSQTGTMYDGNNVNLRLPSEPDRYWQSLWAEPIASQNNRPASPGGAGTASSASSSKVGGQH